MSTVAEIKEAIARLSHSDYRELMAEPVPHSDDDWDRQMTDDAESGKFDFVDRSLTAALVEGTVLPLEEGFEKEA